MKRRTVMKKLMVPVLALMACATTAVVAYAVVVFDPISGTGFVGKGDLQVPWGWNNAVMQANAEGVSFGYELIEEADYDVVCEWDTVTGGKTPKTIHHVVATTADIDSSVAYDVSKSTRRNPQGSVNGFFLLGGENVVVDESDLPAVGDACIGGDTPDDTKPGVVTAVTLVVGSELSSETLYASHPLAATIAIWPPAPVLP
jgi:hypothetical protein